MEFLVALVKHHKNEVEEALQFDPTLRSEIEYDLKQFERAKKDKLVGKESCFLGASWSLFPHFCWVRRETSMKLSVIPILLLLFPFFFFIHKPLSMLKHPLASPLISPLPQLLPPAPPAVCRSAVANLCLLIWTCRHCLRRASSSPL